MAEPEDVATMPVDSAVPSRREPPLTTPDPPRRVPSDRHTLTSLSLQFTANGFVYSTYLARLPEIRLHAGISISTLGLVMMIGNLAGFLATFLTTSVVSRLGSKRVMSGCGLLYVLALPFIGLATTPVMLVVALIGMMLMNVFVDSGTALQASSFSNNRSHPVMSRLWGLYSLGTVGGGLAASLIASAGVPVTVHLVCAGIILGLIVLIAAPGLPADADRSLYKKPRAARRTTRWWYIGGFTLALGIASAAQVPLDIVPGEWATFRVTDDLGGGPAAAAITYFAFAFGMTAGRLGGDFVLARVNVVRLTWLGTGLSLVGLVVAASVPSIGVAMIGFALAGLGVSAISPLLADIAAKAPGRLGAGLQVMFVGDRLAGLLTPLAIGPLAGTALLTVGNAMLIVAVPSAIVLVISATMALHRAQLTPRRDGTP